MSHLLNNSNQPNSDHSWMTDPPPPPPPSLSSVRRQVKKVTHDDDNDSSLTSRGNDKNVDIETLIQDLGWHGQMGQLAQIDINLLVNDDKTGLRQELLDHYIGELGIGSVLNNVVGQTEDGRESFWKLSDYRRAAIQIQKTAQKYHRPPVIWGLDSVHGANYLYDTITTPQPINLAASFNVTLSKKAGVIASRDTRRAGITWLFSPLIGLSWSSSWSRVYETFGEDPHVVGTMAMFMIQGIQEPSSSSTSSSSSSMMIPSRAAACAKHFIGYSIPHNGHDRAPSWIPTRHLYQYFVPPWKQVINNGGQVQVDTIMESYTEVDGIPNVANRQTLGKLLRKRLGFQGMVVTDYHEIFNLMDWHHTVNSTNQALEQALMEGSVDMSMIANEPDAFFAGVSLLQNRTGISKRVETSVRRVLELKYKLNMFQESFNMNMTNGDTNTEDINHGPSPMEIQDALDMTRQTIILVENKQHALPLKRSSQEDSLLTILVTGPTSNSQSFQTGGWTGQWQGVNSNREKDWFTYGSTVWEALKRESSSSNWDVSYECGVDIMGRDCDTADDKLMELHQEQEEQHQTTTSSSSSSVLGKVKGWVGWNDDDTVGDPDLSIERAMNAAKGKNVIIVCLGEENYAEKPGDIRSLSLPAGQYELVRGLREASPDSKIILIYFGGRPRLLREVVDHVDAVLLGFLAGPLAGDAVVDILTGRFNPSAKLPITYPKFEDGGGVPYLHAVSDMCTKDTGGTLPHWENVPCDVQWSFGHGLSYSNFEINSVATNVTDIVYQRGVNPEESSSLGVEVVIMNTGTMAGAETIMIFSFDDVRSTTPEYKRLRSFEKVWLEPGSSMKVTLEIPVDDFRFVGPHDDSHYILEDGLRFRLGVGADVDCRSNHDDRRCTSPITIQAGSDYVGACEAACQLWSTSGCGDTLGLTDKRCWKMCTGIHQDAGVDFEMNNDGWGWNYVECMESIIGNESFDSKKDCWKLTHFCRDVLATPKMDEYGHGITPAEFDTMAPLTLILSVLAGIIASIFVALKMHGSFERKERDPYGDVQFSSVRTQEVI